MRNAKGGKKLPPFMGLSICILAFFRGVVDG